MSLLADRVLFSVVSGRYSYHLTDTLTGMGPTHITGHCPQSADETFTEQHNGISFNGQTVQDIP
jgi:hypothetical protein